MTKGPVRFGTLASSSRGRLKKEVMRFSACNHLFVSILLQKKRYADYLSLNDDG